MLKKFCTGLVVSLSLLLAACGSGSANNRTEETKAAEPKSEAVTFYVTRHGKTMFNTSHRAQGWSDTPLTQPGIEVAEQLGKGLKQEGIEFTAAYSSDLGRARETTEIVLENNGQTTLGYTEDERLREICFGTYEGASDEEMWDKIAHELGYENRFAYWESGKMENRELYDTIKSIDETGMAEGFEDVQTRMQTALKEIAEKTAKNGGGNVLVVAHGMSIMGLVDDMTTERPEGGQLPNASVTKIAYEDGNFEVLELGSMTYVEKGK